MSEAHITIKRNSDGTYYIEEFGVHYGQASFSKAVAWMVERLISLEPQDLQENER